jgi:hypothetical protein
MAQDIRSLFKNHQKVSNLKMPKGHEARFLEKLDKQLPEYTIKKRNRFYYIAASIVILLGITYSVYKYSNHSSIEIPKNQNIVDTQNTENSETLKTLGDISPDLKKVEDYYLANINLELSKVKLTSENKELFDSYVLRLEELNKEYKKLSIELTENGPNELTVNALIDNLKLRLNLLHRLKEQLKDLNDSELSKNIS